MFKGLKSARVQPAKAQDDAALETPEVIDFATPESGKDDSRPDGAVADLQLVNRCVGGEVAAWEELYGRCHEPLCAAIRAKLRQGVADPNLVDELAARVWYAVVKNDGELLARYDPQRGGRVITFLRAIARDELSRHFRSERRRMEREVESLRERACTPSKEVGVPIAASFNEFVQTLTPREQSFCENYLMSEAGDAELALKSASYSSANIWQLTHRIYKKMLAFLGKNS
jgi:DNA-directed RNA polymerase specialized sigma24 family protein